MVAVIFYVLLIFLAAAVVAFILWKGSSKKSLPEPTPQPKDTIPPITLRSNVSANETQGSAPELRTDSSLEKDAWEDWSDDLYGEASRELVAELAITYCDRNRQITHRDITVEKYAKTPDGGVLAAFCHLRQARRPFYFSRIQLVADRSDGAVIENLSAWLDERYEASPKGLRDRFIKDNEAALGALFFVSKADGAFRSKERVVIRNFCADQGLDDPTIQELVVEFVSGWAVPSRIAYGKDLRALLDRDETYRREVLNRAQEIVGTDKTTRDEEIRALERMQRELKLPAQPMPSTGVTERSE